MTLSYLALAALSCAAMAFVASLLSDQVRTLVTGEIEAGKVLRKKTYLAFGFGLIFFAPLFVPNHFSSSFQLAAFCIFSLVLYVLFICDLETMVLPDFLTKPLLWLGLLFSCTAYSDVSPENAIFGAAFGYLSLFVINAVSRLAMGRQGIGGGDFKLLAAIGAFGGFKIAALTLLLVPFVGVASYFVIPKRLISEDGEMPLGLSLAICGMVGLLFGESICDYYFTLVHL
ncbi:prepilin peptidase [Photobacterium leiognathi]|uniref:prepilin peptidase n=1 Tax=Photobacterium leiognathi TaxID=553611 RepID=UPI0029826175|nr:A24 family peptidase [Photobacterium leiognathi]